MSKLNVLVLSLFISLISYQYGFATINGLQDGVADGGRNGNPGVKIRLTQNGLNYLNGAVRRQMAQIMPKIQTDDVTINNMGATVTVSNGRVTSYKPPDVQNMNFQPADKIILNMQNMRISMTGHFVASAMFLNMAGDFDGTADNVDVTYTIKVFKQGNGQIGIKTQNCNANVGHFDFVVGNVGALGKAVEMVKGVMSNKIRQELSRQICDQGTRNFDDAANKQLSSTPTKISLNEVTDDGEIRTSNGDNDDQKRTRNVNTGIVANQQVASDVSGSGKADNQGGNQRKRRPNKQGRRRDKRNGNGDNNQKSSNAMNAMTKNITKQLMLDYSSIRDPTVTNNYLETYHKGEISYKGQGGTPFYPNDLHEPTPYPTDRMAYVVASDYVLNSMLYQSFTHGLLKYRISAEDSPDLAEYLKTSCDGAFLLDMCLGSIIPQIQDSFPNSQAETYLESTKTAPVIFFRNDGLVHIQAPVTVTLNAKKNGERKTMAVADVDVTARSKLFIENQQVKGESTVEKLNIRMKTNNIKGFGKKETDELTATTKGLVETMVNSYLRKGIPIPLIKGLKLTNSKVNIYERTLRVDSDFQLDDAVLSQMASKALSDSGHGVHFDGNGD